MVSLSKTGHSFTRRAQLSLTDLYGFVIHQGQTCKKGHYYSIVKGLDKEWYECNDRQITKLKNGISSEDTEQAYILFYQKRIVDTRRELQTVLQKKNSYKSNHSAPVKLT